MQGQQKIEIVVNKETGEMTVHIDGVIGPACDDIAKMVAELTGGATKEEFTPEYYQQQALGQQARMGR